jgi:hypothetical protein
MANYLKATDFAAKDALLSGDPNKIVKGTEIDDEFDAIQTAVNSKANSASPALTGTPTSPTATFGTNTTQIATTAFVQAAISAAYPVGSIYISTIATNPATTFGFGTWEEFGAGKVLVGQDTGDTAFDTLEETGGSKDAAIVEHTHTIDDPGHVHNFRVYEGQSPQFQNQMGYFESVTNGGDRLVTANYNTDATGLVLESTTGITVDSTGSSGTNANLQPYVVVKMWKRTA